VVEGREKDAAEKKSNNQKAKHFKPDCWRIAFLIVPNLYRVFMRRTGHYPSGPAFALEKPLVGLSGRLGGPPHAGATPGDTARSPPPKAGPTNECS
jgi:hypothetical protein